VVGEEEEDKILLAFTRAIMERINAATETTHADIPVANPPITRPLEGG